MVPQLKRKTDEAGKGHRRPSIDTTAEWSRFLSGLVHEIKTPLASLGMIAELLGKEPPGAVENKTQRYGTQLRTLTHEMQLLIQDVGALARLAAGTTRVRNDGFALGDLLDGVTEEVRGRGWEHGISLATDVVGDPDTVLRTDPKHVEDAVVALLETAVALADQRVLLAVRVTGSEVVFTFRPDRDLDADVDLEDLFDPFGSHLSRLLRQSGARPLGPLLARERARILGGDLEVLSADGGTAFVLRIPLGI